MACGIRKNESYSRKSFKRIQRNEKVPKQILMFPILEWNSFLVWLYMYWRDIPVNEAYLSGRSRIGCWACPERSLKEFKILERTHPTIMSNFKNILLKYAQKNNIENINDWIDFGKWRLRATKYDKKFIRSSPLCSQNQQILYKINDISKVSKIIEFLKVFGDYEEIGKIKLIKNHQMEISIIGDNVRVGFFDSTKKMKKLFVRQFSKALNCIDCGACIGNCKKGALNTINKRLHISNNCDHCLKCISSKNLRKGCISLNYSKNLTLVNI